MSSADLSVKIVSALVSAHKSGRGREKERWGNAVWVKGVWELSLSLFLSLYCSFGRCALVYHVKLISDQCPGCFHRAAEACTVGKHWEECEHLALLQSTEPGAAHGPVAVTSPCFFSSPQADNTWTHPPLLCKLPQGASMLCLLINCGMSATFPLWSNVNVIRWANKVIELVLV